MNGIPFERVVETCARAAHEVNRAYCLCIGDAEVFPHWEESPEWQRESVRKGVLGALEGNNPRESHESWLAEKERTGWKYGPVKDPEKKEHPCFLPYDELSPQQKVKDDLFVCTVQLMASRLGGLGVKI